MGEYLSIETAKKLAGIEKALEINKKIIELKPLNAQIIFLLDKQQKILEGRYENKSRSIWKTN